MSDTCKTCYYLRKGTCRIKPPTVVPLLTTVANPNDRERVWCGWPPVQLDGWCECYTNKANIKGLMMFKLLKKPLKMGDKQMRNRNYLLLIICICFTFVFINYVKPFQSGGKEIPVNEMLEGIDQFQEQYNVGEKELDPMMRNPDKEDWYIKKVLMPTLSNSK